MEFSGLQGKPKERRFEAERLWMLNLVEMHPVLRSLPPDIKKSLVVEIRDWSDLPVNRRRRKQLKRDGLIAHIYSGKPEGLTHLLDIDIRPEARYASGQRRVCRADVCGLAPQS